MNQVFAQQRVLKYAAALAFLAIGAAGLGLGAAFVMGEGVNTKAWMDAAQKAGLVTGNVVGSATLVLVGGIFGAVGGVLALISALTTKPDGSSPATKFVAWSAVIAAIVSGVLMIAGGVAIQTNPYADVLGPDSYVYNQILSSQQLTGQKQLQQLFGLAVFETCCRPFNWTAAAAFGPCDQACPGPTSGALTNPLINRLNIPANILAELCTCVPASQATTYQTILATVNTQTCTAFKNMKIVLGDDLAIPRVGLKISFVRNQLFPGVQVIKTPLVGYNLDPPSDPTGQTPTGYGFGCGLGYQKGVMWFQQLYYQQYVEPMGASGLGVGGAMLGAAFLIVGLAVFDTFSEQADAKAQNWEGSLEANWNRMNQPPQPGGQVQPQAGMQMQAAPMYAPNPQYQGQPGVGIVGGGGNPAAAQLAARVAEFYRIYDPKRSQADVDVIVQWGLQNGEAALNAKLKGKYNADLTTMGAGGGGGGPPI